MNYLTDKEGFVRKTVPARTFRDLIVWRKAHEFVLTVYGLRKILQRMNGLD